MVGQNHEGNGYRVVTNWRVEDETSLMISSQRAAGPQVITHLGEQTCLPLSAIVYPRFASCLDCLNVVGYYMVHV